ncbi:hypothetical protein [Gallaecimonas sp. GXIMD4217]|uniref:hypothetical protein n=1 Tax=Gallaecimonas sp. GXIMD4217 TaxID=3131927 RepID=UPI00311ACC26
MSLPFVIRAGKKAKAKLLKDGFHQDQFGAMLGASGGPKWFILAGLDRYLAGEFWPGRDRPLQLLGSSAGGWRMAAHACAEPVAAIARFRDHYHRLTYAEDASAADVTASSKAMIDTLLGKGGSGQILANPIMKLHLITAGCRGPLASDSRGLQLPGLGLAALANLVHRRSLGAFFSRGVFHVDDRPHWLETGDLPTEYLRLTETSLPLALEATGAIPLVLQGVRGIPGSRHRVHRDGGIIDYHFDMQLRPDGLVLYPHFYSHPIPGWFDKGLTWRKPKAAHYDNVVILAPHPELVAGLPGGKLSDRTDFARLTDAERIACWQQVMDAGERMAEAFANSLRSGSWTRALADY